MLGIILNSYTPYSLRQYLLIKPNAHQYAQFPGCLAQQIDPSLSCILFYKIVWEYIRVYANIPKSQVFFLILGLQPLLPYIMEYLSHVAIVCIITLPSLNLELSFILYYGISFWVSVQILITMELFYLHRFFNNMSTSLLYFVQKFNL